MQQVHAGAVGGQQPHARRADGAEQPRDGHPGRRSAGGTASRRSSARPWGCRCRRWRRSTSTASAPAASAPRITVPALPGSRTLVRTTSRRGDRSSTAARSTSSGRQTASRPCGAGVSHMAARTSAVTSWTRTPASTAALSTLGVPGRGLRGVVQVPDEPGPVGHDLADGLRALREEETLPGTHRAPGQRPHRLHAIGSRVGQHGGCPGAWCRRRCLRRRRSRRPRPGPGRGPGRSRPAP